MSLAFCSAAELARRIRRKEIGCEELLDLYLGRIERHNGALNAVVAMDVAGARRRARAADAALRKDEHWGPLHGVPITVKDSFDVAGLPSTFGVPELKDHRPARTAPAIQHLIDAGAVVVGKTNVPTYLVGWTTRNEIYGTTSNPWDLSRSPGGSSGGSAAAVAAGLTGFDIGVDFGGGVRNVAHYCGIYGHKPTYGITNWIGHVMSGIGTKPDLCAIGPVARSAEDLELALSLIAGPDPIEASAWTLQLPPPRKAALAELRVAVMLDDAHFEVDNEVQERVKAVADFLEKKGAKVSYQARPAIDTASAFNVFGGLLMAGLTARQGDEKFWSRLAHLRKRFMSVDSSDGGPPIERIFTYADWQRLDTARHLLRQAWREFFREQDVLLCPAAPTVAIPHEPNTEWHQREITIKGKRTSMADPTFWGGFFTVAHLPATVAPAGLSKSGLPVGVQIVGPEYGDLTCVALAHGLEREFRGFVPPKGWD
jgi:amidase